MLRKALGERPQDHRYVVTVPGRGYRLAENVHLIAGDELSIVAASHSKVELQVKETKPWAWISAAVILLLAFAGAVWFSVHRKTVLSEKDTVVLADFANSTGDPVFDGTLRQGMAVQLEQSPFLSVISEQRIRHTLSLMGRSPDAPLTPELAREVCERTASAAVLEGSISSLGSQYVLGLRAKRCRSGSILDEVQAQAAKKEEVLTALSQISSKFRTRVGESLTTVRELGIPLQEATTPSLEALKAYSEARKVSFSTGQAAAIPLLQHAIAIDPNFAMAHALLGRLYGDIWESVLSADSTRKAYNLRDRVSERERFFITLSYDLQVTGNLEKVQQTGELWIHTYPRDTEPLGFLSWIYQEVGKYEASAEAARKAIALDPDFTPGYINLAWAYIFLNRPEEAEKTLYKASQRKMEIPELLLLRYYLSFVKGDQAGMERAAAMSQEKPGAEDWMSDAQACAQAYFGRLGEARKMSRRAVDLARQADQSERAAMYEAGAAVREAFLGNAPEARRRALAAQELSTGRDVQYGAALAYAFSGDFSRSQALSIDLEKRFPEDTIVRFTYLPVLRSFVGINHGEASKAIEVLQIAAPYDLAVPGSWSGFFGSLYPVYMRGQAYLAAHRGAEAATEFRKILNHRTVVGSDLVGALARLQLSRALAMSADKADAKAAYQDFLALWKDADPDIPILRQAKLEYAQLQ
jgi:predicted Zn-dependent protease